jgi:AbiU2
LRASRATARLYSRPGNDLTRHFRLIVNAVARLGWHGSNLSGRGPMESDITSPMQPLPLNQRLDRIGQHIVRARLFLDLWFYFEERDSRRKIIETMRDYNEFFRFTPHAYLVAYVIYMAGVFDKRRDTISLPPLVREMKAAGQLKGQDAATVDALLVEATHVADKVLILRHKAFAHRSAHISYNDVFKMAAVRPDQLRDLTDMALKIVNRLLLARELADQFFTELPREAAEEMMKALGTKRR